MLRRFIALLTLFILLSAALYAQTLTLQPYGVSPRGVAISTTDIYTYAYNGLTNVGVGTLTYLKAAVTGQKFSSQTWTVTKKPSGSTATLGAGKDIQNDSTQVYTFTFDKPGTYTVKVTNGVYSAEITINGAKYLGYTNTTGGLACATCHSSKVTEWGKTNHATMFTRAMSATPGLSGPTDHYSANCISCHTTGYDNNPTAVNDGFDDLTFTYPTIITSTTYNTLVAQFPDAMKRGNIQCESCHGPASGHYGATSDSRMEATFEVAVCAWCHDSGTHHFFPEQFKASLHAEAVNESGSGREGCVRCHTGKGFMQYANGIETTDPYFDPSYTPITCAACHDPHSEEHPNQLRKIDVALLTPGGTTTPITTAGKGALCMNCHQSRTEANAAIAATSISSRFGPHHGPQGDILFGNNMLELGSVQLLSSGHKWVEDACIKCHMYTLSNVSDAQGNIIKMGGHSFGMSTPEGVDNMEACAQCHGYTFGTSFEDAKFFLNGNGDHDNDGTVEGLQEEVRGMIAKIYDAIKTAKGTLTPAKSWGDIYLSAFWNAITAEEDRSNGIHNPKYVVTALKGAMVSLNIPTGVRDEQLIPSEYVVYQNYPNPFNPSTTIRFALPKSSHVKVTIYDALGKEVQTLVNNELASGTHNIQWNARNLASGLYLYRVEAENFVKVNKMLLLK